MGNLTVRDACIEIAGRRLLTGVDLSVAPGEIAAIVGPNGVGKTTLLRALAGDVRPAAGTIDLDGVAIAEMAPAARARRLTILSGDGSAPAISVREAVETGRFAHHAWWDWRRTPADRAAADDAIGRVALAALADWPFDTLSSGERQRAWIALALAQGANVLLLDEPTSHLDVRYAHEVLALLRRVARDGATVAVVLHDLNEAAAYADSVALLGDGRLLAYGPPAEVLQPTLLERAFGVGFVAVDVAGTRRVFSEHAREVK